MEIKNLTWHTITVFLDNWTKKEIFPSIEYGRLNITQTIRVVWDINWIPILEMDFTVLEHQIPPVEKWVIYIVSGLVAQKIKRDDFYIVGDTVRWVDRGKILWCKWLCKNPYL